MNSKEYSEKAPLTDISTHELEYYFKGMVEEFGEFFGHLKRIDRDDGGKITMKRFLKMRKEMGDFEWYRIRAWTKICELLDIPFVPIEDLWEENIDKLQLRLNNGTLQGEGSDRK